MLCAVRLKRYLFVGPSGSEKSTVLDAHAALLTPPKWVDFNVAAREAERHGCDRSVMTYLRGAWAQQTGDSGEYLSQYRTFTNLQSRHALPSQVLPHSASRTLNSIIPIARSVAIDSFHIGASSSN
jgi:hypothetical protein